MKERLWAASIHLGFSTMVAIGVLGLVFLGWYRAPLDSVSGVREILIVLLGIDVVLGPVLTFLVFDRRKRSLRFDLGCIAAVQLVALAYGIYTVETGRPHHLVFVKDRFEVVSRADISAEDRAAATGNEFAQATALGPRIVAADMPVSDQERRDILLESVQGGRDIQHFPKQYRAYSTQAGLAAAKARPLDDLRELNPSQLDVLDKAVRQTGAAEGSLKFLPIKGPKGDATMLIDASSGEIRGMIGLRPWQD